MNKKPKKKGKKTTHLWRYTNRRVAGKGRNYYAISIPPEFYDEFLDKEMNVTQCGSSLMATISGCEIKKWR